MRRRLAKKSAVGLPLNDQSAPAVTTVSQSASHMPPNNTNANTNANANTNTNTNTTSEPTALNANVPNAPNAPNAEAPKQNTAYEGTRDGLILGFNIVKDVSEASEILAPLKAACALVIRGLETTRVRSSVPIPHLIPSVLIPSFLIPYSLGPQFSVLGSRSSVLQWRAFS